MGDSDHSPLVGRRLARPDHGPDILPVVATTPSATFTPTPLPLVDEQPRERADAARNRARVLDAAAELFVRHGIEHVSMDAVAAAAGVGKGTLYRRFGDRCGLALALLDERERSFQEAILRGPPPLGPGAAPVERLVAYFDACFDFLDANTPLSLAAQGGSAGGRYRGAVYSARHHHVSVLLREALPDADVGVLAHTLLSPVVADLHLHLRDDLGVALERVKAAQERIVRALVPGP